jgi:hypothetical protein
VRIALHEECCNEADPTLRSAMGQEALPKAIRRGSGLASCESASGLDAGSRERAEYKCHAVERHATCVGPERRPNAERRTKGGDHEHFRCMRDLDRDRAS